MDYPYETTRSAKPVDKRCYFCPREAEKFVGGDIPSCEPCSAQAIRAQAREEQRRKR